MPTPEEVARAEIDRQLEMAGWVVQDIAALNRFAGRGVAVREFRLARGYGQADYLLYVDGKAVGVVEAKPVGTTLTGVEPQAERYSHGLPEDLPAHVRPLPFLYQSTGVETRFTNLLDPDARSRRVFTFHRPETLAEWVAPAATAGRDLRLAAERERGDVLVLRPPAASYAVGSGNLRQGLRNMPPLVGDDLWPVQRRAIENLERSLAAHRPRALIQMATGSGKTFTAVTEIYRLIRHAGARRVLFLVDRANLGRQALGEFQGYRSPETGRTFAEEYNIQHMTSNKLDAVARVTIATIQRLYSILKGEPDLPADVDETPLAHLADVVREPVPVTYNPRLPIEYFDVIFIDECHRSIYTLWKHVLEYFDAFLIGLTATPSKQTFGFFDQNLVMEYGHQQAVADGVNVDYDVYRIRTRITTQGSRVEAGYYVTWRDRETRKERWEKLDDDLDYPPEALDRSVVTPDQIRTIIRAFRDRVLTEIFPDRQEVPKTLIFAKSDSHAEDIVQIVREEFGKGNDFAQKITYRVTGVSTDDLIAQFRNSYNPRIAVTVDMISTGTDIKPLEIVMFMRDVKSRMLFEQMKGRGVRVIGADDLKSVTPDAPGKTRFVLVDAVGVTEREEFNDSPSLERHPYVPLEKLLNTVALGSTDPEVASTLAGRLARLDLRLDREERERIRDAANGTSLQEITAGIVRALDPDVQLEAARERSGLGPKEEPTTAQLAAARDALIADALRPLAANPPLRDLILEIKRSKEQLIDAISQDELLEAGFDAQARERAEALTRSFEQYLEEHKDEIAALRLIHGSDAPHRLTYAEARELAQAIQTPPKEWTPEALWAAYEALDAARVRRASKPRLLTNIVRLVRYAMHVDDELEPHPEVARERFQTWIAEQERAGRGFTAEQREWLEMMRDHIAANLEITREDFEYAPFAQKGGLAGAHRAFGSELQRIMEELTEVLAA
ncbi:MAG TPA: type I restriction-modification enzyme R subunit C-terminal domain-containing protein [Longimicrobiales bacterium]